MNSDVSPSRGRNLGIALVLAAATFALYLRAGGFEFLNYDDPDYVSENPVVAQGLTADGLSWAFGFHAANWHPLTWLAHMLDVELFGVTPGPMHLVNAGLHALNAGLCFLAFVALTRALAPSLLVAALFAAHPLRVQCVAWIAERKELLAAACFFALLLAYARWSRTRRPLAYALAFLALALGCMAKPMLVTAPFVLLLLEVWPLGRLTRATAGRVVLESLPFFALAATSAVLTLLAQRAGGAVGELAALTPLERLWTAGGGVLAYLRATLWPSGLAAFYPHPLLAGGSVLVPGVIGLALALALLALAWRARKSAPAVGTGLCWFLGMLVPVLGLVQVGDQAWADRYAYLPTLGLYVALVFGVAELVRARAELAAGLWLAGLVAAGLLGFVSARRLSDWQDSRTLFERALVVTQGNWIAHNNLGLVYLERRDLARAREHFEAAANLRPSFVQARFNLGLTQEASRDFLGAMASYKAALNVRPGHAESLVRLALLAHAEGDNEQAIAYFDEAIQKNPGLGPVWVGYARLLLELGNVDRAANCAASALKLAPTLTDAHLVLAEVALRRNDLDEADQRLARAEALGPESADERALRGQWALRKGDGARARKEFERALTLDPNSPRARHDFGALFLSLHDYDAAKAQFQALDDIRPGDPQAQLGLAAIALEQERPEEAIERLEALLAHPPELAIARMNLAVAYERTHDWKRALLNYEALFKLGSPDPDAACAAAWIFATGPDETLLDGERAVKLAQYANSRKSANALEVLAAALARAGDYEGAVTAEEQAIAQARSAGEKRQLEERLTLYRAQKPYTRSR
jgi:tetratricopeptide (TPR) repeat protein